MREDTIGIVTLLSRQHFEKGEYVLHIEVLLHKHSETKAKRRLEKEGYVDHPCLCRTAISPPIFVTYDDNKPFEIRFSISGCLQPRVKLKEVRYTLIRFFWIFSIKALLEFTTLHVILEYILKWRVKVNGSALLHFWLFIFLTSLISHT